LLEIEMISKQRRFVIVFTFINTFLASAHILPPSAQFFVIERAFLAVARSLQGPLELVAFSILLINGNLSPLLMFLMISLLAFAIAWVCRNLHIDKDVLPSIIFIYILFGLLSVYAGNIVVSTPSSCEIEISPSLSQKVVVYNEYGWNPGASYFLLENDESTDSWKQVDWVRLEYAISNPCESVDTIFH
jgi:hypothetical protein